MARQTYLLSVLLVSSLLLIELTVTQLLLLLHHKSPDALDVAIVGGGITGMYAAYRLRNANKRIGLFECSNRIGGRMFTYHLPCCPSLDIELGGMRFKPQEHRIVNRLAAEMDLPVVPFPKTDPDKKPTALYYLRDQHLSEKDILYGRIPYALNAKEKENQHRLLNYYLEKLLSLNDDRSLLQRVHDPEVKTKLNSLPFEVALDLVASPDGKAFVLNQGGVVSQVSAKYGSAALLGFRSIADHFQDVFMTVEGGMSSLPVKLHKCFEESSEKHKTFLGYRLLSIRKTEGKQYALKFQLTSTKDDDTMLDIKESTYETLAKNVILAVPVAALGAIQWTPFQENSFQRKIALLEIVTVCKVFLVFNHPWWRDCENSSLVTYSDQIYQVSSEVVSHDEAHVLLASNSNFTNTYRTLQSCGESIQGSAPGDMRVSTVMKDFILDQLSLSYGVPRCKIPEPIGGVAKFWDSSPYGGGLQYWKCGLMDQGVLDSIQRPMPAEDVFVVGTDVSAGTGFEIWAEGGLSVVDQILSRKPFLLT